MMLPTAASFKRNVMALLNRAEQSSGPGSSGPVSRRYRPAPSWLREVFHVDYLPFLVGLHRPLQNRLDVMFRLVVAAILSPESEDVPGRLPACRRGHLPEV